MLRNLLLASVLAMLPYAALAETLPESLAKAYQTNPVLDAARAQKRAIDEQLALANAGWLPTISADGSIGRDNTDFENLPDRNSTPKALSLTASQPLFRGGRTIAAGRGAEASVAAAAAQLYSTEQSVLLNAATVYHDVLRDQAVLELNQKNVEVLRAQLDAAQSRFKVGDITRTDVSQAESRLARAEADRVAANGNYNSSKASFERVFAAPPSNLTKPDSSLNFATTLPASLAEAMELAEKNNPNFIAARETEVAANAQVDEQFGSLLPEANITGQLRRSWEETTLTNDKVDSASVVARVTMPLYQAGAEHARVRQAKQTASQRRLELDEARRQAREGAIRAWESWQAAKASAVARQAQVKASQLALEGVRQENQVGSRTVLDVLDAEQELLDAKVSLILADRDEAVSSYQLLASIGEFTAKNLQLKVDLYNADEHANRTARRLFGTWE